MAATEFFDYQIEALKNSYKKEHIKLKEETKRTLDATIENRFQTQHLMEEYRELYEALRTKYEANLTANLELSRQVRELMDENNSLNKTVREQREALNKSRRLGKIIARVR